MTQRSHLRIVPPLPIDDEGNPTAELSTEDQEAAEEACRNTLFRVLRRVLDPPVVVVSLGTDEYLSLRVKPKYTTQLMTDLCSLAREGITQLRGCSDPCIGSATDALYWVGLQYTNELRVSVAIASEGLTLEDVARKVSAAVSLAYTDIELLAVSTEVE